MPQTIPLCLRTLPITLTLWKKPLTDAAETSMRGDAYNGGLPAEGGARPEAKLLESISTGLPSVKLLNMLQAGKAKSL